MQKTQNNRRFAILLAAGDGKRMKSDQPKVLCRVLGKPMLCWVEDACRAAGVEDVTVVAGDRPELLQAVATPACRFVSQQQRKGTGHAVMMAAEVLQGGGDVIVLYGDAPLIGAAEINAAYARHKQEGNAITLMTARVEDPTGYGRILHDEAGGVSRIVEQKDADEAQRRISEINAGVYWFDAAFLAGALGRLTTDNAQGEYYLTDTVAIAVADGLSVGAYPCAGGDAVLGANSRKDLQKLNGIARERVLERHLENGVDIPLDHGVMIGPDVEIAHDALILPGTILEGHTRIGAHCVIGPNSVLRDAVVEEGAEIKDSYVTESSIGRYATVGPFSQLRPDTHLGDGVKIGDFVELKNATLGEKTSVAHLTYLGDCEIGSWCNFGCGVVTANYDGSHKYRTVVGDRVFVGCNTNLIPPVTLGDGAYTAAGTTIDEDVPAGAMAIGRVPQQVKEAWADRHIAFKKEHR